jgi:hypothetical protein
MWKNERENERERETGGKRHKGDFPYWSAVGIQRPRKGLRRLVNDNTSGQCDDHRSVATALFQSPRCSENAEGNAFDAENGALYHHTTRNRSSKPFVSSSVVINK